MNLDRVSLIKMVGVNPDLVKVVTEAAHTWDGNPFIVFEGLRTVERERMLIRTGKSSLKDPYRCRHCPIPGGRGGCAVDLVPLVDNQPSWDWKLLTPLAKHVKDTAKELHIPIEWGGDWKTFKDGPHFQLPWKEYPK
jgi:peptidoglycan L-alanyl-D-glutamate endopeptidase CwlK